MNFNDVKFTMFIFEFIVNTTDDLSIIGDFVNTFSQKDPSGPRIGVVSLQAKRQAVETLRIYCWPQWVSHIINVDDVQLAYDS